ncbi:MAG: transglycosylase SLT domain-containing protein [Polyangia bacterium]
MMKREFPIRRPSPRAKLGTFGARSGLWLLLSASQALAAGPEVHTTAADGGRTAIDPKDDRVQRRAIRGGALDASRESAELRELRSFETEVFPRAGLRESLVRPHEGSSLHGGSGPDGLPDGLHTPLPEKPETPPPSSSVPWLQALKLLDNLGLAPTFVRFEAHVIKYLEFYKDERRGRSIMASWLRRQGRYKALIEQALDKYQLPRFLLYVSMIESGYDPHDRSHKGAVGLWQFLPEGARIYGLRVDYWVDERQDPLRSTEAAARYLGDLKARFGSWHLALAAFNAGYGAVLRAMQKYNTNDYWELCRHEDGLPWETLLYVPKAIATALVGENKGFFGYDEMVPDPPLTFDSVTVHSSVSLAGAAKAIGATSEDVQRLNPHLRRGRTPPLGPGETWELRLPTGTAAQFVAAYDYRGEKLEPYIVRFGERIEDIARVRAVAASRLRSINGIEDATEVRAGLTLLVPPAKASFDPGQNGSLAGDEIVVVAVPDKNFSVPGKKQIFYRTISGDSIWSIARFFKVKDTDLLRWNNLDPEATLATKMVLSLWIDPQVDTSQVVLVDPLRVRVVTTGSDEFFELVETLRGRRRLQIRVAAGDTLERIGKRFGLSAADMERINRMPRTTELQPGQTVIAYQNMSASERSALIRKLLAGESLDAPAVDSKDEKGGLAVYGPPAPLSDEKGAYGPPHPGSVTAPSGDSSRADADGDVAFPKADTSTGSDAQPVPFGPPSPTKKPGTVPAEKVKPTPSAEPLPSTSEPASLEDEVP